MLQGVEKLRLVDGNPQNRHLQTRKPNADGRRNAVFGQDTLKHQGHNLDDGFFRRSSGSFFQRLGSVTQVAYRLLDMHLSIDDAWLLNLRIYCATMAQLHWLGLNGRLLNLLVLEFAHQHRKLWRCLGRSGIRKPRNILREQTLEMPHDPLRPHFGPGQWRSSGLHAGFFINAAIAGGWMCAIQIPLPLF